MSAASVHPHDYSGAIPVRIEPKVLRALSRISPLRVALAIAKEWGSVTVAIAAAIHLDAWWATLVAVVYVGARQHALTIIAHDASHFRLLAHRGANEWVGNLLLAWPMFISVQGFRHFHGRHHRFLNAERDGNRELWHTHGADGRVSPEWRYPKTVGELAGKLARRAALWTGLFWMVRGLVGGFMFGASAKEHVVRIVFWVVVASGLSAAEAWPEFLIYWVLPYSTWHIFAQYVRLICEHSAVHSEDPAFAETRSTIPGFWARQFVLPCNVGYHLEHHWYPGVPFYRLPELHRHLARDPRFQAHAQRSNSVLASLRACVRTSGSGRH